MTASLLDQLREKVGHAASELVSLKKEREKLLAEIGLMQEENRRARRITREYQELITERKKLKEKLQRLYDKLDKLKI